MCCANYVSVIYVCHISSTAFYVIVNVCPPYSLTISVLVLHVLVQLWVRIPAIIE